MQRLIAFVLALLGTMVSSHASELCPDEQATQQVPVDPARCAALDPVIRKPSALPLDQYEAKLNEFFGQYCHRRLDAGWKMDKTVRDAGPFIATQANGSWTGSENGTHQPVLIWYSPEMIAWLRVNRPVDPTKAPANPAPVPDGAIIVKEMYDNPPASNCRVPDLLRLKPVKQGAAVMIRDSAASKDGWFWGWYGWPGSGWKVDWPAQQGNPPPFMGFGQYCTNCHASARDNQTFSSLGNIKGEPGTFLSFLSQDFFATQSFGVPSQETEARTAMLALPPGHRPVPPHLRFLELAREGRAEALRAVLPANAEFGAALGLRSFATPAPLPSLQMPSQTYDNVWMPGHGPAERGEFVTSDQCLGCHSAGGTGLQYEMTAPVPGSSSLLYNYSPYGTWRTSPMGLAGRDPIFFAQLASETQTFHKGASSKVQDTCLGCHGILGQRQSNIEGPKGGQCTDFLREMVDAVPYPDGNPQAPLAHFGGLARDGISCGACHHMVLGKADTARFAGQPQNRCVMERQDFLNPGTTGFARTFTGSFFVGPADRIYGPFDDPKQASMKHALDIRPEHSSTLLSSEACGTCHTVHLPVMVDAQAVGHTYEQATYPEWAFSAYRTGDSPDGKLPFGPGALAQSCQGCHMPRADATGAPFRSKIAGIQEHSNFPQVDHGLPASDIDLPVRSGFAKHTLVGLNVFLVEMAKQFNTILGMRTQDPMLADQGFSPLQLTEQAMLDQASHSSAEIKVSGAAIDAGTLSATVSVINKTGHKFPSGVGFRRAFVDFVVSDASGNVLWESGRTNDTGALVDEQGKPIEGEFWWNDDCSARLNGPGNNPHQPHYQVITQQNQVQIFQELVTAPPPHGPAQCGHDAQPVGELTTSFLSICAPLKDNRLLPHGFMPLDQRIAIAHALGAGSDMAEDVGPVGTSGDPAYSAGGYDSFQYRVPLAGLAAQPAKIMATLYYQATPPFYLQDRACTATGTDKERLGLVTSHLNLAGTRAEKWKLEMVSTGQVALPQP